jgi:hypothetical protein
VFFFVSGRLHCFGRLLLHFVVLLVAVFGILLIFLLLLFLSGRVAVRKTKVRRVVVFRFVVKFGFVGVFFDVFFGSFGLDGLFKDLPSFVDGCCWCSLSERILKKRLEI